MSDGFVLSVQLIDRMETNLFPAGYKMEAHFHWVIDVKSSLSGLTKICWQTQFITCTPVWRFFGGDGCPTSNVPRGVHPGKKMLMPKPGRKHRATPSPEPFP